MPSKGLQQLDQIEGRTTPSFISYTHLFECATCYRPHDPSEHKLKPYTTGATKSITAEENVKWNILEEEDKWTQAEMQQKIKIIIHVCNLQYSNKNKKQDQKK